MTLGRAVVLALLDAQHGAVREDDISGRRAEKHVGVLDGVIVHRALWRKGCNVETEKKDRQERHWIDLQAVDVTRTAEGLP